MHVRFCLAFLALGLMIDALPQARGADTPIKSANDPQVKFDQLYGEWKKIIAEMRQKSLEYRAAKEEQKKKILVEFEEIRSRGLKLESRLKQAAEAAYKAAPNKNQTVTDFVATMADDAEKKDQYEEALRLANLLIENNFENKVIYALAGKAAFNADDFDTAAKYLKIAKEANVLEDSPGGGYLAIVDDYKKKWQKEQEIRAAEEKADDLPRVKLKTSKGDIVIELFENEAPNTVANFISLVDSKFYDGLPFHRVINRFVAQGGDPKGDGTGGPGYTIPCECLDENHRLHFRGSISMAHLGSPNTGGSQFFLTFVPTTHLDGKHTVFGRVIEGMNVLGQLRKHEPHDTEAPDKIIEATVVRKRDHAYEPKKNPDVADKKAAAK